MWHTRQRLQTCSQKSTTGTKADEKCCRHGLRLYLGTYMTIFNAWSRVEIQWNNVTIYNSIFNTYKQNQTNMKNISINNFLFCGIVNRIDVNHINHHWSTENQGLSTGNTCIYMYIYYIYIYIYIYVSDWWFGTCFHILGTIIPLD